MKPTPAQRKLLQELSQPAHYLMRDFLADGTTRITPHRFSESTVRGLFEEEWIARVRVDAPQRVLPYATAVVQTEYYRLTPAGRAALEES